MSEGKLYRYDSTDDWVFVSDMQYRIGKRAMGVLKAYLIHHWRKIMYRPKRRATRPPKVAAAKVDKGDPLVDLIGYREIEPPSDRSTPG